MPNTMPKFLRDYFATLSGYRKEKVADWADGSPYVADEILELVSEEEEDGNSRQRTVARED